MLHVGEYFSKASKEGVLCGNVDMTYTHVWEDGSVTFTL